MTSILKNVSTKLHENNLLLVSAESCTGGWIAKEITDLAGSSAIFERGFVTYSNLAKQEMLGVSVNTLNNFGAVSEQVVMEMVEGALNNSKADISISISGVAGPGGGTVEKPVGMVCFGWMMRGKKAQVKTKTFEGDRNSIRKQAVNYCFTGIIQLIEGKK